MSNLCWLSEVQMARLQAFFPKNHGRPRVDDPLPSHGLLANRERGARSERHNLHQSQWLALVRCAEGIRSIQDPLQPLEAMERDGRIRSDLRGAGSRSGGTDDHHD